MEKEELIKYLTEKINGLKQENQEHMKIIEESGCTNINISDYNANVNAIKIIKFILLIQTLNLIDCIRKGNGLSSMFATIGFVYILTMLLKLKLGVDIIECLKEVEKSMLENNENIDKMQNAVTFLQSLTKEEEEKYLKFKF